MINPDKYVTKYYIMNASRNQTGRWILWSLWSNGVHKVIGSFGKEYLAFAETVASDANKRLGIEND